MATAVAVTTATTGVAAADFGSSGGGFGSSSGSLGGFGSSDGEMTVTLVRHAQSEANVAHVLSTVIPGPPLTTKGESQAQELATTLADKQYDSAWSSTLLRTQQTGAPTAAQKHLRITTEIGFREIQAGDLEGKSEIDFGGAYFEAPIKWMSGDLDARMPGALNGHEFDKQFDDALLRVQRSGSTHPVIFTHGGSIMVWTTMNTDVDKTKWQTDRMNNCGHVIIKGSPQKGWKLVEWVGTAPGITQ